MFKRLIIIILTVVYFMFGAGKVRAQQTILSISPPLLELFIKPGKSILIAYTLQNLGDPNIIKTKVMPFEPKGNLGNIEVKNEFSGPVRFNLDNSDIALEQSFFLKTRGSQQLLLRIRVPEGAPNGDYYYTLLAETEPPPAAEGIYSSGAKATIGSNIIITVTGSGNVDAVGKIALFDVLPRYKLSIMGKVIKIFDSNDPVPVVMYLENQGKNFIKPNGKINLRGNFGETAEYEIVPKNVLAESQRLLVATPSAQIDCNRKDKPDVFCEKPISLLIKGFFLGKYQLTGSIVLGENGSTVTASTSYLALPLKFVFALAVALLVAFLVIKKVRSNQED
ncbi:hypothetical protein GYA28_03755 [Candidatus Roizmanbacteria bacterium]|nr:hypothetical protein [Candidatus Roizmanbacteria bacterium]